MSRRKLAGDAAAKLVNAVITNLNSLAHLKTAGLLSLTEPAVRVFVRLWRWVWPASIVCSAGYECLTTSLVFAWNERWDRAAAASMAFQRRLVSHPVQTVASGPAQLPRHSARAVVPSVITSASLCSVFSVLFSIVSIAGASVDF